MLYVERIPTRDNIYKRRMVKVGRDWPDLQHTVTLRRVRRSRSKTFTARTNEVGEQYALPVTQDSLARRLFFLRHSHIGTFSS